MSDKESSINVNTGQQMPKIILPCIDGTQFDSSSLKGKKYLVTFFRFATCPFCNLRMAELLRMKKEVGGNLEIVAVFESDLEHLKIHANGHMKVFPVLADKNRKYYKLFGVKKSVLGMLKGMIFRLPTGIKGVLKGYFPREISSRYFTMPLSLLVNDQGIIQVVYHGKDEGDHIPLEEVIRFSQDG